LSLLGLRVELQVRRASEGAACFAENHRSLTSAAILNLIQVKLQTAQIAAAKSEPMVMSALPQKADIAEHRCDVR